MASARDLHGAYIDAELAVAGAPSGPLSGTTFAAKDLFDVAGHVTGFGNPKWRATHTPAQATAPAVAALLAAGASLRGKTHMDELAYSLNGENAHYGTPANPAAPGRIPGGSSSGSAVAVAAALCDFSLGSDTGGSVRTPAGYCGIFGFRPSWGRVSTAGVCAFAHSFDTVGWFARDAGMLRRVGLQLLSQPAQDPTCRPPTAAASAAAASSAPPPPPPAAAAAASRWLVSTDAFQLAEEATGRAVYGALSARMPGVTAVLGQPSEVDVAAGLAAQGLGRLAEWAEVFRVVQAGEIWAELGPWVSSNQPGFGPGIKERFAMASGITDEQWREASAKRAAIRRHVLGLLGPDGVLAVPSMPGPAPRMGTSGPAMDDWRRRAISVLCIAGLCGLPQVSIPVARVDGCPVGLGLIGAPGSDEALLALTERLAMALEAPQ